MRTNVESRGALAIQRSRALDYFMLAKPELTFLSVLTALAGFFLGSGGNLHGLAVFHLLLGTAMVGGGAGALNQVLERDYDALMKRTENRPLPAGRLSTAEAGAFGTALSVLGIILLALMVNPLTGFLGAATSMTYLYLYTPLKRITPLSTIVGGIPGALPPVMGWAAARNNLDTEAWVLFGILFFWQMPHFFALAWMYRKDYARAGYRMLSVVDPQGGKTASHVVGYTLLLIPVSLLPGVLGMLGMLYASGASILGLGFLLAALRLLRARSNTAARIVFFASLIYLPLLMLLMVLDTIVV